MNLKPSFAAVCLLVIAGCGGEPAAPPSESHQAHVHVAPHGGTLVQIGEHQFNIEFVAGPDGLLNAYVLDGHAENFVRIQAASFTVMATAGGRQETLEFKAQASGATGESVGSTSAFQTQADWLKTASGFDGVLQEIDINGTVFKSVQFKFP